MNHNIAISGQTAVITGGSRGIGAGIALRLAEMGARTVILGRDRVALDATAQQIASRQGDCLALVCDVESEAEVERAAGEIERRMEAPQILVNCAGVGLLGRQLLDCSTRLGARHQHQPARGLLCHSSICAGHGEAPERPHHQHLLPCGQESAAWGCNLRGQQMGFERAQLLVAEELRAHNVRVSVVCPGSVNTGFSHHEGHDPTRMPTPADVAHAVAMLVTQQPQSFISEVILRPTQKP